MKTVVALKRDEETGKEEFLCVECNERYAKNYIKTKCPEFDPEEDECRVMENGKPYVYHTEVHYI